jgi:CBS domain-containing protein/RNA polymerase-binding transcription factor DksA
MTVQVKEWMSGEPIGCRADRSALEACDEMLDHGIRHLPVVDPRGRVVGVLSIDDLRAALPPGASPRQALGAGDRDGLEGYRVGELMTYAPYTVRPETPLEEAARVLAEQRIGCLPVVDGDGVLVGILSETDALRALASALGDRARKAGPPRTPLEALVERLREERERVARDMGRWSETGRRFATHVEEEPVDFGERAADLSEAERAGIFGDLAARRLEQIERALERAEQGSLGVCERCGRAIPLSRLQALPGATLCIACARASE